MAKKKSQSLADGTQLGAYTITRLLGRGGMGEVYEAYEHRLQRRVALKVISPEKIRDHGEEELIRRFMQEARTLAQVNHPNVVTIYAIDRVEDTQFIAMEFVDGVSLKELLERYVLSADEAAPLFLQMLEGLRCLHENRIVHRDLKPHNLILRPNGQIKLLDFGIAKKVGDHDSDHTSVGVIVGTVAYMAPEVAAGVPATARSDLWSLGAIFFECLVGQPLIALNGGVVKGVNPQQSPDALFPKEALPWIPSDMRQIIHKLCLSRPEDRYGTAAQVMDDLRRYQSLRPQVSQQVFLSLAKKVENLNDAKKKIEKTNVPLAALKRILAISVMMESSNSVSKPELGNPEETQAIDLNPPNEDSIVLKPETLQKAITQFEKDASTPVPVAMAPIAAAAPPPTPVQWSGKQRVRPTVRRQKRNSGWWPAAAAAAVVLGVVAVMLDVTGTRVRGPRTTSPNAEPVAHQTTAPTRVELKQPAPDQSLWLEQTEIPTLRWSQPVNPGEYAIQIASDSDFKNLVLSEPVAGTFYRPSRLLADGRYFWRLRPTGPRGQTVGPSVFTVSYKTPVDLVTPEVQAVLSPGRNGAVASVTFLWTCKQGATKYRFQASSDSGFTKLVHERSLSACDLPQIGLPVGAHFWRVRYEEPVIGPWSQARAVTVKGNAAVVTPPQQAQSAPPVVPTPTAANPPPRRPQRPTFESEQPRLRDAKAKVTLQFSQAARTIAAARKSLANPPVLEWDALDGAKTYVVQISAAADFSVLVSEETSTRSRYEWRKPQGGRYFWRVRGVNGAGQMSAFSERGELDVDLPAPTLKSEYLLQSDGGKAGLSWTPIPLAEKYIVRMSETRSMASATDEVRTLPELGFTTSGTKYIKVAAAGPNGEPVSEFSDTAAVTVAAVAKLATPEKLLPPDAARVTARGRISVVFTWTSVDSAIGYVIEVAQDPAFANVIQRKTVTNPKWVFKGAQLKGKIYWRVRAESPEGASDWTPPSTFEVQ